MNRHYLLLKLCWMYFLFNNLIYINAVVVNKNTKSENTISSIRIMIN